MNSMARTIEVAPAHQIDPVRATGDPCLAALLDVPLTRYQVQKRANGGPHSSINHYLDSRLRFPFTSSRQR
jgi:hypothetical protein